MVWSSVASSAQSASDRLRPGLDVLRRGMVTTRPCALAFVVVDTHWVAGLNLGDIPVVRFWRRREESLLFCYPAGFDSRRADFITVTTAKHL